MMVSKEITKELIEYCKENEWWEVETKYLIEDLEKILKDLEILEILKGIIKNNVFDVGMLDDRPNGETWLSCEDYGITLKTEDYKKIVGWKNEKV